MQDSVTGSLNAAADLGPAAGGQAGGTPGETPAGHLMRMMVAVDESAARQLLCEVQRAEAPAGEKQAGREVLACDVNVPDAQTEADAPGNAVSNVEPRDQFGRRKRR